MTGNPCLTKEKMTAKSHRNKSLPKRVGGSDNREPSSLKTKKLPEASLRGEFNLIGTGAGTRTPDPRIMIPLLYQLSYTGTDGKDSVIPPAVQLSRPVLDQWTSGNDTGFWKP